MYIQLTIATYVTCTFRDCACGLQILGDFILDCIESYILHLACRSDVDINNRLRYVSLLGSA